MIRSSLSDTNLPSWDKSGIATFTRADQLANVRRPISRRHTADACLADPGPLLVVGCAPKGVGPGLCLGGERVAFPVKD